MNDVSLVPTDDMPPALIWSANIDNPYPRRFDQHDLKELMAFTGIATPDAFWIVTRARLFAWRRDAEQHAFFGATTRRKLASLSSLFDYLCEANVVARNSGNQCTQSRG